MATPISILEVILTGDNAITAQAVARKFKIDRVQAEGHIVRLVTASTARPRSRGRTSTSQWDRRRDGKRRRHPREKRPAGVSPESRNDAHIHRQPFFACINNILGVPISSGVLYPVFGVLLPPMIAAAVMSISSVSVISNALPAISDRARGASRA